MFSKKILFFIMIGLIVASLIGCTGEKNAGADSEDTGELVATVNSIGISAKDFKAAVDSMVSYYEQFGIDFEDEEGSTFLEQIRQQAIDELIQTEVLLQTAKERGYEVPDEKIAEELEQIKAQFSTDEEFQTALEQNQLSEEKLKEILASELQIEQFIINEIAEVTITEEEIQQMYDQYKLEYELQIEEGAEEDQEFPSFEEVKVDIEAQLKQQKKEEQFWQVLEELIANSDIEIFI